MIIRVEHRRSWTTIVNATIDDDRLSWRALGVLVWLLRQPDKWQANYRHLASLRGEGQHSMRVVLKELEACGYLERRREQGDGGRLRWVQVIYESPQVTPCGDYQRAVDHDMADRALVSDRIASNGRATTERATTEERDAAVAAPTRSTSWEIPKVALDGGHLDDAIALCMKFAGQLSERGYVKPEAVTSTACSKRWVLDMEQLLRLDGRDPGQVRRVLDWLHAGTDEVASFWRTNVRSPAKLREKWAVMAEQYERQRRPKGKAAVLGTPTPEVEELIARAQANGAARRGGHPPLSSALSLPSSSVREVAP